LYGYALLCAETLRHAFDLAVRYHGLATPVMACDWSQQGDRIVWTYAPCARAPDPAPRAWSAREHQFFLDMQFALHVTMTKDAMGPWCAPALARYSTPQPAHAEAIAEALGCGVLFDQPRNELHYPARWLDRSSHLANPITAAQMSGTCARLLEEFKWQSGLARRVVDELTRTPGRFPELDSVAAALCISARTLRRKLEAEGTSYSGLLAHVRHALAVDYLSSTLLSIDDVAAALQFSDTASFRHAFKRWSGRTPNEFRDRGRFDAQRVRADHLRAGASGR
ncbi:MAG: AraC family transcriptional regulator ligand-binding domain-containing protein, partial [Burkholderiales bacterium]|nr:AraC family transcriptional regulator ligand-binding domain-containing protein [Burkholderiales bacterium]